MEYELIIEKGKSKSLIAFLKQLNFVKISPVKRMAPTKKTSVTEKKSIPYFNAVSGWDIDANVLRKKSIRNIAKR